MTSKNYFRALTILHGALVAGLLLFSLIIAFLTWLKKSGAPDMGLYSVLIYVVPVTTVACILASQFLFKKNVKPLWDENDLSIKMTAYRGLLLTRFAILEVAAIFAVITAFVLFDLFFLVFAALIIIVMIYVRPTISSAIRDLQLSEQEIMIVEDPDGVIENG